MSYCILPFVNLEARTDGTISPCCIMQDQAPENLANGDKLSDVWQGEWLNKYRKDFLRGIKPKACKNCWKEEEAGIQSKRLRELHYFKVEHGLKNLEESTPTPISLDLKLGNICNSKCRICTSFASSQWGKEEIAYFPQDEERVKLFNRGGAWPKNNEIFWDEIDQWVPHIKKLEFFGGEPLMIERHYDILEKCIELDVAKDISISYNTNGSIFPQNKVHLWQQFKNVHIFFSIDDINDRFNYIRHPGNFPDVMQNVGNFLQLEGNFEFGIFQTIGILNIVTMKELTTFMEKFFDIPIHYNMVFQPEHMSPKVLPKHIKKIITEMYSGEQPDYVTRTLNFMNGEQYSTEKWNQFMHVTKFGDEYRGEDFKTVFPEFYNIIKDEWNR